MGCRSANTTALYFDLPQKHRNGGLKMVFTD
jgi:hypothetical protein